MGTMNHATILKISEARAITKKSIMETEQRLARRVKRDVVKWTSRRLNKEILRASRAGCESTVIVLSDVTRMIHILGWSIAEGLVKEANEYFQDMMSEYAVEVAVNKYLGTMDLTISWEEA